MHGYARHTLLFFLVVIALPLSLYSQSGEELLRAGDEYYKNGDYMKAAETWKQALDADPKNAEAKQKLEKLHAEKYKNDKEYYEQKITALALKKKSSTTAAKEVTIDWDAVDGATKYIVQIKDESDKTLVDKTVKENKITFPVSPGNYRIRVGAYNIFEKIGAWSEWTELKVVTRDSPEALPFLGVPSHGFNFAAGYLYSFVMSDYSDMYESSPKGWLMRFGFEMRTIHMFELMPVVKNLHLEYELSRRLYKNRDSLSDYTITLEIVSMGLNVAYITDFNFPVNFAFRLGGGAAYSRQSLKVNDPIITLATPSKLTSTDPCYNFSASLLIESGLSMFFEAGAGMFLVDYIAVDMKAISLFFLAGIHI